MLAVVPAMLEFCFGQPGGIDDTFPATELQGTLTFAEGTPDGGIVVGRWFRNETGLTSSLLKLLASGEVDPDFSQGITFRRADGGFGLVDSAVVDIVGNIYVGGAFDVCTIFPEPALLNCTQMVPSTKPSCQILMPVAVFSRI